MGEALSVDAGTTGWVVRNRRTRNVPNTRFDDISTVVPGTVDDDEAFVCVPLLAHDRVVGTLNVYRTGLDRAFTDAEVALVERFATMAALAYEAARQREHLREQAATDGLTGLLNHRGAQERLRREIEAAAAGGRSLSVVVLDLDHFKQINDSHGHAEGDKALAAAAAKLRSVVREGDAVGRLGGEEFVLVLPGVTGEAGRRSGRARPRRARRGARRPPPARVLGRRRHLPGGRPGGRRPARARRRRPLRRQARRPPADAPLRRQPRRPPVTRRRARRGRGAAAPRPRRDPAGVPARARARHRPRVRLRGARARRRRARAPAGPVVRPGAPLRPRGRARGARAARRARRRRPPGRHLPRPQRQPARPARAPRRWTPCRTTSRTS